MIASLLTELEASANASLGGAITAVAAKYDITLVSTFTVERWFQRERDINRPSYPVVGLYWAGPTKTGLVLPAKGIRDSLHKVEATWVHQSTDKSVIERHILYMPEALVAWLELVPRSSTDPAKTIHQIQPPAGQGIEITPSAVNTRKSADGTIAYQWSVTAQFDVRTREQP